MLVQFEVEAGKYCPNSARSILEVIKDALNKAITHCENQVEIAINSGYEIKSDDTLFWEKENYKEILNSIQLCEETNQ